ncbi:Sodium/hydrogen exchanger family-domain-containing protein [Cladochytrium replicatum]|nr:Sodium/hydrogen exchanger family-domain-containing protein [Cladochytrium replicatum]
MAILRKCTLVALLVISVLLSIIPLSATEEISVNHFERQNVRALKAREQSLFPRVDFEAAAGGATTTKPSAKVSTRTSTRAAAASPTKAKNANEEHAESAEAEKVSEAESKEHESAVETALPFVLVSLGVGVVLSWLLGLIPSSFRPPYTVMLFILGALIALIHDKTNGFGPLLGPSVAVLETPDSKALLFLVLPPLLFESSAAADWHVLRRVLNSSIILAFPGVVICALLIAVYFMFVPNYGFSFGTAMTVGSILGATDPVAVVAALSTLNAPARLNLLIDGEAMLNDGSAFVFFLVFIDLAAGVQKSVASMIITFVQLSFGGPLFGLIAAWITFQFNQLVLKTSPDKPPSTLEVGAIMVAVYVVFFIGDVVFHVSSVLAIVTFGFYMSATGRFNVSHDGLHHNHGVISLVSFFANTAIFTVAGAMTYFYVTVETISSLYNWGILLGLYIALIVIRAIMALVLWPILARLGYGLDWKDVVLLIWGGLRGGMSLILVILVKENTAIPLQTRSLIGFHVAGIVLGTIVINGMTTEPLYRALKIDVANPFHSAQVSKVLHQIDNEVDGDDDHSHNGGHYGGEESLRSQLKNDPFYSKADWATVESLVPMLGTVSKVEGYSISFQDRANDPNSTLRRAGSSMRKVARDGASRPDISAGGHAYMSENNRGNSPSGKYTAPSSGDRDQKLNLEPAKADYNEYESKTYGTYTVRERYARLREEDGVGYSQSARANRRLSTTVSNIQKTYPRTSSRMITQQQADAIRRATQLLDTSQFGQRRSLLQSMKGDKVLDQEAALEKGTPALIPESTEATPDEIRYYLRTTFLSAMKCRWHVLEEQGTLTNASLVILNEAADVANENGMSARISIGKYRMETLETEKLDLFWSEVVSALPMKLENPQSVGFFERLKHHNVTTRVVISVEAVFAVLKAGMEMLNVFVEVEAAANKGENVLSQYVDELCSEIRVVNSKARSLLMRYEAMFPSVVGALRTSHVASLIVAAKRKVAEELCDESGVLDNGSKDQIIAFLDKRVKFIRGILD